MAQSREKRLVPTTLAGFLLALLAGAAFTIAAAQDREPDPAPPQMALTSPIHDAGHVERGEMITHEFTFRNTGGSDLVILSTKAG